MDAHPSPTDPSLSTDLSNASETRSSPVDNSLQMFECSVICIGIIGILANGGMLVGTFRSGQLFQKDTKMLIFNQMSIDLVACLMVVSTYSVKVASIDYTVDSAGLRSLCSLLESENLLYGFLANSNASLVTIALERYLKIVRWSYSRHNYKIWMTKLMIASAWLIGPLVVTLPASFTALVVDGTCVPLASWSSKWLGNLFKSCACLTFYVTPTIVMMTCYWKIIQILRNRGRVKPGNLNSAWLQTRSFQKQVSVLKTLIALVVCGAILCAPNEIYFILLDPFGLEMFTSFRYFTVFLVFLSVTLNPFIYAARQFDLKEAIFKLIRCHRPGIEPSEARSNSIPNIRVFTVEK